MSAYSVVPRIGLDFDQNNFFCWDARPGDNLNLIPSPLSLFALGYSGEGSATIVATNSVTDYGKEYFEVYLTSGLTDGIRIGTADTIEVSESSTYTLKLWSKGPGISFEIKVYNQDDNLIDLKTFTETDDWSPHYITFTSGAGDTSVYCTVRKNSIAITGTHYITGLMLLSGNGSGPGFNTGNTLSLYENVTKYAQSVQTEIGIMQPDKRVAPEGKATVHFNNETKLFSPEYASSPVYNYVQPGLCLSVQFQDLTGTWIQKWLGFIEKIKVGTYFDYSVTIEAKSGLQRVYDHEYTGSLLSSVTAAEILANLVDSYIPPGAPGTWVLDIGLLGVNTYLGDGSLYSDFDTGESYILFGEDWLTLKEESRKRSTGETFKVLEDLMDAELGLFYVDEEGILHFLDFQGQAALFDTAETLDLSTIALSLDYQYGLDAGLFNDITVKWYKKESITNGIVGWSESAFSIDDGDTEEKKISLKIDDITYIVTSASVTLNHESGSVGTATATVVLDDTNNCTVTVTNSSGDTADIESIKITGTGYAIYPVQEINSVDTDSVVDYCQRQKMFDIKLVDTENKALSIAGRQLGVLSQPRGRFTSFTIGHKTPDTYGKIVSTSLGKAFYISENQTGVTDRPVVIVGQKLSWSPRSLESTFILTEGISTQFWVLNLSLLGDSTRLI